MPSVRGEEPVGFFSLPLELRDKIVSSKAFIGTVLKTPLLIRFLLFGQYDVLHQLQDEATFGIDGQLTVRFPLPRLHHISRRFRVECDRRMPAQPLLTVSQKYEDFPRDTWIDDPKQMEQVVCPRIVRLRHMRSQILVKRLHVDLHACGTIAGAARNWSSLFDSVSAGLRWARAFVKNTCSLATSVQMRIRFMLDVIDDIQDVGNFVHVHPFETWHTKESDCCVEVVVDCPSEQESHEEEFATTKTLAVWRPGRHWWFDEQEIGRYQALAKLQSEWSTAATSPKPSEGEEISEYQDLGEGEDISTTAELGERDGVPHQDPQTS